MGGMKTLGVLVVILVVLAGAWWIFQGRPQDNAASRPVTDIEMYRIPNDDLNSIDLVYNGRQMQLRKENGQWNVTVDGATLPGDQARISSSSLALGAAVAERVVNEAPTDYRQFGLDPPLATIRVGGGGRSGGMDLGTVNPIGNLGYARIPGRPEVYLISPSWLQVVDGLYRDLPFVRPTPTPGPSPTPVPTATPTPRPAPTFTVPN